MEIFISILSSFIASLIWVFCTILFDFYAKKKIDILLELAKDSSRLFVSSINYTDYHTALQQADNLINLIINISNSIKFMTFRFKKGKRKFFFTVLYNAFYNLSVFKNINIGYEGETENQARCEHYGTDYLYKIHVDRFDETFLTFSFELLQYVNNCKGLKKGFNQRLLHYSDDQKRMILEQVISKHTFNEKKVRQHFMRKSGFYKDKYIKMIEHFYKR